jgi:secreted trypsin-like serine protease
MSFMNLFVEPVIANISKPESRIHGGEVVKSKGEVPYIVNIQHTNKYLRCGGSIFNSDTVLTAAHCFLIDGALIPPEELGNYMVVAGDHDYLVEEGNEQIRWMKQVFIHPEYNPGEYANDIAIIRLDQPYTYNKFVQPLAIGSPPFEALDGGQLPQLFMYVP